MGRRRPAIAGASRRYSRELAFTSSKAKRWKYSANLSKLSIELGYCGATSGECGPEARSAPGSRLQALRRLSRRFP